MPDPVAENNAFAEEIKRLGEQQAAAALETRQMLEALNRRTSILRDPAESAPPQRAEFRYENPTESARQLAREVIREEIAPHINNALAGTWQVNRTMARQNAAANPAVADVFKHFGDLIDAEMQAAVAPAGHVDATYWVRVAKQIAFDKRDALSQKNQSARDTFTETGGAGGAGPFKDATEIDPDTAELLRKQGKDPKDPKVITFYNKAVARLQGVA